MTNVIDIGKKKGAQFGLEFIAGPVEEEVDTRNLRVIQTARNKQAINKAATEGYFPLLKRVVPSAEIFSKFAVYQDRKTGQIHVTGDYRSGPGNCETDDYIEVIPFTNYYPHSFESPYAAYLIPKDIKVGEQVILEDVIEDVVGGRWSQGDTFRVKSCEAIWNGKEFELQVRPDDGDYTVLG